mgnify:CR=1 FL=1
MMKTLLEIIPPPRDWDPDRLDRWVRRTTAVLARFEGLVLNIPEVVSEGRQSPRVIGYREKWSPEAFAGFVQRRLPDAPVILNKIVVRVPRPRLLRWFDDRVAEVHTRFVLVGGEEGVDYPGPTVCAAAEMLRARHPAIEIGGITIFTRPGESARIQQKIDAGITFFVSQIAFETANLTQVLFELKQQLGIPAVPAIFVSLAPARRLRDIAFMQWLGVEFPSAILAWLRDDEPTLPLRSFLILDRLLGEIRALASHGNLGINLEHVMLANLDMTVEFLHRLHLPPAPD